MIAILALSATLASSPASCEALKTLTLPNTTIVAAEMVATGPFAQPGRGGAPQLPPAEGRGRGTGGGTFVAAPPQILPAHCRINAILRPSPDSEIEMEAWLPENWNGKFQFVGGGGWAGVISFPAMVSAVQEGYATASTDTGHKGGNALFAVNHPEKVVDFAYRAVHETTVQTKALIAKFYERPARLSYDWNGCSTGGRQGLMEAQKFPDDFDAIIAGAPANFQTHLHAWDLSVAVPALKDPAAAVPAPKLRMLNEAAVNTCDAQDGVKDGLINNPRACKFDPSVLLCKGGDNPTCLTAPQLESVKRAYATTKLKSGEAVFPGKEPGSETGWNVLGGEVAPGVSVGSFLVAYNDAKWDAKTFDLDRDLKITDEKVGSIINAVNPDLSAFKAHGGKLLMYHGWNDTAISPGNSINYYESVVRKISEKSGGKQAEDFVRLYMAPGMQHCGGGPGPNQINYMAIMERWREGNQTPASIEAFHVANNRVDMSRPLCPYPQVATYKGVGGPNDAANFVCK